MTPPRSESIEIGPSGGVMVGSGDDPRRGAACEGRGRVLLRAHALFIERGFDGVSMQQIADAAGMTKAALYYHFKDKEDLFGHVVRREFDRVAAALVVALREEGDLREHLERVARQLFASISADLGRLVGDMKHHVSATRQEALGCRATPPYDLLRPRLERAVAEGELRADVDLDLALSIFFGMIFGQVQEAKLGHPAGPDDRLAAAVVSVLLDGIGAGPRPEPGKKRPRPKARTRATTPRPA